MKVTVFAVVLILGIVQGIFLVISLQSLKNSNKEANRFLSLFIVLIVFTMSGRLVIEMDMGISFPNILALPDAIIFLYGPTLYFYLRKLVSEYEVSLKSDTKHFIPAIIYLVSEIPLLLEPNSFLRQLWTDYTTVRFILIEGAALVLSIFYLMLFRNLLREYEDELNNQFSFHQFPKYLRTISNCMIATLLVWGISYFSWITGNYNIISKVGYRTVWIILPFLTYGLGYFAIQRPEFFKLNPASLQKKEEENEEKIELIEWRKKLEIYMSNEKPYLNPTLSLKELSDQIQLKPYQTSKLINSAFSRNFNDFVNEYRVEEFMKRATKEVLVTKTILSIALESGFNSKTTFNTAFKKLTNKTPIQFIKSN
tara:strand:- start:16191 stop:17294 length:1104 start_codon:yes stop_codon:yes gene_type:complete